MTHRHPLVRQLVALAVVVACGGGGGILATGCASKFPPPPNAVKAPSAAFDVPPKEMVEKVRAVLEAPPDPIGVAEQDKGTIVTNFQRFPGEWHIGRRWQEQTRYRIDVIPDFDQPTARCMVEVREFTETRAAEGMKWEPFEGGREERGQALLERIRQQVKS